MSAREITYKNFEISLVVFKPNITTNHAITYTNFTRVTQIKLPLPGRPILLITRMITDRTGLHSFLSPLYYYYIITIKIIPLEAE